MKHCIHFANLKVKVQIAEKSKVQYSEKVFVPRYFCEAEQSFLTGLAERTMSTAMKDLWLLCPGICYNDVWTDWAAQPPSAHADRRGLRHPLRHHIQKYCICLGQSAGAWVEGWRGVERLLDLRARGVSAEEKTSHKSHNCSPQNMKSLFFHFLTGFPAFNSRLSAAA